MVRTRLVVHAALLACVAALLAALPSGASTAPVEQDPSASASPPAAEECVTLGRTIASVWSGRRSEEGPVCATLSQNGSGRVRFVQPVGQEPVPSRVVDARGNTVCEHPGSYRACPLDGTPPFRAVVPAGTPHDFRISVVGLRAPRRGCPSLDAGGFGSRDGVDVVLDEGRFAACFSIPGDELLGRSSLYAFERVTGTGQARLIVRGEVLGAADRECASEAAGEVGTLVCFGHDDTGYTTSVLLVSDGRPATWRLVRRDPRAGRGCSPVASTAIGGPVTRATTSSYVAMDCWSVPAEPTDGFAIDLLDQDGTSTPHVFNGRGHYQCGVGVPVCQAEGNRHYVVVAVPGAPVAADGHDYELQPWQVADVRGWSPECERYGDYDQPFGPVTGTLSATSSGRCVLLDSFVGASYAFDLGSAAPQPVARALVTRHNGYFERCRATSGHSIRCEQLGDPFKTAPLLVSRPDGVATLDYDITGECEQQTRCDVLPPLEPVTEPVVVGRHAVGEWLGVDTGSWGPDGPEGFDYQWLVDGVPVPWFEGQRPDLLLTEEMRGHDISVRVITDQPYYESTVVLTEPRTVRAAPAELRRAPEIEGVARVGRELTVDPGRWRPNPDRYRFVWYAGDRELAAGGRRLTLRRRHVDTRITVRVVAVADGDRVGSASTRSHRVRPR